MPNSLHVGADFLTQPIVMPAPETVELLLPLRPPDRAGPLRQALSLHPRHPLHPRSRHCGRLEHRHLHRRRPRHHHGTHRRHPLSGLEFRTRQTTVAFGLSAVGLACAAWLLFQAARELTGGVFLPGKGTR